MKWSKRSVVELSAALAMTGAVLTLGVLQYRWTGEISRVEQARLKTSLGTSVKAFADEFSYEVQQLCESLELDPEAPGTSLDSRISHDYVNWATTAANPGLVAAVYALKIDGVHPATLERLDLRNARFQEVGWPGALEPAHQFLRQQTATLSGMVDDRQALYYPWTFYDDRIDQNDPLLIRPIFDVSSSRGRAGPDVRLIGFLLVGLGRDFLQKQYLPSLVERSFGGTAIRNFDVAVRTANAQSQTVYVSDPGFQASAAPPDATVNLFDLISDQARRRGHAPLQSSIPAQQWQLMVQHPAGSVEVAVAKLRRRSLATGFGLLTVLAGSMVLILSVARRAERLANLQMDFVTGVSHELCTPLAVIQSAAENLADGVVDDPEQMQAYGTMIREQSRRLERLVDEVLLFAAHRAGRTTCELRPIAIADTVAQSLARSAPMLRDAGFDVEQEISADLPLVVADPGAIGKCMENLFNNAVKYASASRWVAVRARLVPIPNPEVQITVEDKGIGIPARDLPNIFEPFYRVQGVRDGHFRGVGLGLYLVKHMMEQMGGRVSVSSELGRGSFFVLHFPVANSLER